MQKIFMKIFNWTIVKRFLNFLKKIRIYNKKYKSKMVKYFKGKFKSQLE